MLENVLRRAVLHHFAQVEERRIVRDAAGLLHIVRDHDDRVIFFELEREFFDSGRGDGIEGRGGFVHQEDFGAGREGAGDAEALLLTAGDAERGFLQAVLHLIPKRRAAEAFFHNLVERALLRDALEARAVGDIVVNAFRKRIRLLEDHADGAAERDGIDILVHIDAGEPNVARDAAAGDEIIHAIQRAQKRGFPAARRADERRDSVSFDIQGNILQRLVVAVEKVDVFAAKTDIRINGRAACERCVSDAHFVNHARSPSERFIQ